MSVQTMNLEEDNYDVTDGECPDCEDGALWVNSFELVCDECDTVFRKASTRTGPSTTIADEFYENRISGSDKHRYSNSENMIMPGGFSEAYHGPGIYGTE